MTDMQTSLPLSIVQPSILNPVISFSAHLWPVKWNALGYTFALCIPFQLLHCWCNICTNQSPKIWSTQYHHVIILVHQSWLHLLFIVAFIHRHQVLLKLHCHMVHHSKASNLLFMLATSPSSQVMSWSYPPWSHDSMSCLMCNELLHHHMCKLCNKSKPFHLYGICCSHTCTCGLITCVFHSNTY